MRVKDTLNVGNLYINEGNKSCLFVISKFLDIKEKLLPFLEKSEIKNIKSLDLNDFKKVVDLIDKKEHLTEFGINLIKEIRSHMNERRS